MKDNSAMKDQQNAAELEAAGDEIDGADGIQKIIIPPRLKRRPRKRKFIAGLLAALIPGSGHIYFGLLRKGITFIFIILLDISALLYFSSIGMQINVPLLILLALLLPVIYFYNMYDILQSADRILRYPQDRSMTATVNGSSKRRAIVSEPGISFGLLLLYGGVLLFLFKLKPVWLQFFIENYTAVAISILLLCSGLFLGIREIAKGMIQRDPPNDRPNRRVGRYTASILLMGLAVPLFVDWKDETDYMFMLLKLWPIIPVLWGIEFLLSYFFSKRKGSKLRGTKARLDLRGLLSAIFLAASVFIVAEQEHYLHLWNRVSLNLTVAAVDYGEAKGSKFVKSPLIVPVELNTAQILVNGINGDILLHRAPVEDVEIVTTVWVDQLEGAVAEAISEQSFVDISEGSTITITSQSKAYGDSGKRQPRMDLDITLPEDRRFNFEIRTLNGGITLQNVEAIKDIFLETGNGELILHRVAGNIKGKTLNGAVRARSVQGDVDLSTNGGAMNAWNVMGSLKFTTAVGNISTVDNGGDIDITSKNGNLKINEALSKLHAESLNGRIDVESTYVGGDWDIYSAVGDINLSLPLLGDYTVGGSSGYGDIISDLPGLIIDKKRITGKLGTGEFMLQVEGNSNLYVRKH